MWRYLAVAQTHLRQRTQRAGNKHIPRREWTVNGILPSPYRPGAVDSKPSRTPAERLPGHSTGFLSGATNPSMTRRNGRRKFPRHRGRPEMETFEPMPREFGAEDSKSSDTAPLMIEQSWQREHCAETAPAWRAPFEMRRQRAAKIESPEWEWAAARGRRSKSLSDNRRANPQTC